jgi:hypothetical protein
MTRPSRSRRILLAGCLVAAALAAAAPASAQIAYPGTGVPTSPQPRIGAGYVANIPNQFVGVSAHFLSRRLGGIGLYVDAKFDLDSPADEPGYLPNLTVAEVEAERNDQILRREGSWTSVNAALMRSLTPQMVVYAGAGYSDAREYREYVDEAGQMGMLGLYWVRDEAASGARLNVLGGVMLQISPVLALQLGGESSPGGFTVGASYLIPLR